MNWECSDGCLIATVHYISVPVVRQRCVWWRIAITLPGLAMVGKCVIGQETVHFPLVRARTIGKLKHRAEQINELILMTCARLEEELLLPSSRKEEARLILAAQKGIRL